MSNKTDSVHYFNINDTNAFVDKMYDTFAFLENVDDVTHLFADLADVDSRIFSATHTNGQVYTIVFPTADHSRIVEFDEKMKARKVEHRVRGDFHRMLSEAQVIPINPMHLFEDTDPNLENYQKIAQERLENLKKNGEYSLGPEFEFTLDILNDEYFGGYLMEFLDKKLGTMQFSDDKSQMHENINTLLSIMTEGIKELVRYQREYDIGAPAFSIGKLRDRTRELFTDLYVNQTPQNTMLNAASTHPAEAHIGSADTTHSSVKVSDPSMYGAYIENIAKVLIEKYIRPSLEYNHPEVLNLWEKVAQNQGYDSLAQMVEEATDMSYWVMNSLHTSHGLSHDNTAGLANFHEMQSTGSLLTYFNELTNGLCYSGSYMFGIDTEVDDAREVARLIIASSANGEVDLGSNQNLLKRMIMDVATGVTNVADRAFVYIDRDGDKHLTGQHSSVRARITLPLDKVFGLPTPDFDSLRMENTGKPATPDLFNRYMNSTAISQVLSWGGLISVSEGYTNVFEWLKVNGIEIDTVNNTENARDRTNMQVEGQFNGEYISQLQKVVELVESKLTDGKDESDVPKNIIDTFRYAKRGISQFDLPRTHESNSIQEKVDAFTKNEAYVNYGQLIRDVTRLGSDNLKNFIENNYIQELPENITMGKLVTIFNDWFFGQNLAREMLFHQES